MDALSKVQGQYMKYIVPGKFCQFFEKTSGFQDI